IQINKQKITEINASVNYSSAFLNNYFFIENGKKNKYVVVLNDLSEVTKVKETIKVEIDNLINEIIDTSKKSGIGELFYFIYMVHMLRVSQTVPKNDTKYSDKIFFLKVNDAYEYILQVLAKYCSNDFVKDTTNDLVINQNYTEKLLQLSIKVNSFYEVISMVSTSEDVEFLDTKDKVLRFKLKNTKTNIKLKNIVEYGIRLEKAIFIKKDNIKLREELLNQFILEYSPYSDLFEYEFGINLEEFRSLIDFLCDSILDQMKKIKEYVDYLPTGNVDVLSYKTIMSFSRVFFLEKEYIYNKFGIKIHKILEKLTLNLELLDDHQLNFNIIVRQPLIDINEVFVISPEILLDSLYVNTHYSLLESGKISENYKNRFSGKFMDKISTIAKAYGYEEIGREIDINKGKVQYGDLDLVFKNSKEQFLLVEAKSHSLPLDVYFKDYQATENRLNYLKSNWESKVMNRLNFLERNHQDYGIGHDYKYIIISKMPEIISHFSDLLCFTLDEFEYWLKFDDWSLNFNKLNNEYYQNHKLTLEDLNELNDNLYLGLNF
ncbi:MAG TPA: hypothetical protein VK590_16440, partial [Saprospiraceae bacterium]|nr:hypothetical protein [Saprospiraceae bacterium]